MPRKTKSTWSYVYVQEYNETFGSSVAILMSHLNMDAGNTSKKWLLGIKTDGSQVSREEAAIVFWAWRCLYAEVVGARKENRCMSPSKAYANLIRMAYTRVKAYGAKWYRWYSRQHRKIDAKVVPRKHRDTKLIKTEASAEYRDKSGTLRRGQARSMPH